jgi:Fur family peroxide stress response transcriptional regulator
MNELQAARLRARLTPHRRTVWEVVAARPAHLTAAQIYDVVRARDAHMAIATIYNALHYLVQAGIIAEVRRPDGVIAYDRETRPHDHVICRLCGRLADVPPVPVHEQTAQSYATVARQTGFTVERHRVEFVGCCPSCQAGTDAHTLP